MPFHFPLDRQSLSSSNNIRLLEYLLLVMLTLLMTYMAMQKT